MHKKFLYIFLLCLVTLPGKAQVYTISGQILDIEEHLPIANVTVYINGTNRGTITDSEGLFQLYIDAFPKELILSHVSYEVLSLTIQNAEQLSGLKIKLEKKIVPLAEASIISNSNRKEYISRFKIWFLGKDHAKTGASLQNESALHFIHLGGENFEAYASEPLLIKLPKTGYLLKTDLVHFSLKYNEELGKEHCSILGYFYFREMEAKSHRKLRSYERNRMKTYYNSRLHFCRSLYQNKLQENGYILSRIPYSAGRDSLGNKLNPDFKLNRTDEGGEKPLMYMSDFATSEFRILYHHDISNLPLDLTLPEEEFVYISRSRVYFRKDTILIYPTGRVGDNSILFSGTIGKGVAWMLPEDYNP